MGNMVGLLKKLIKLIELVRRGIPCLFYCATGIYCPGCGGTRAVKYLLEGNLLKSLWYHPLVGYLVLVAGIEIGRWLIFKRRKKGRPYDAEFWNPEKKADNYEMEVSVGIGLILVNWAVKNWALLVLGVNLIP